MYLTDRSAPAKADAGRGRRRGRGPGVAPVVFVLGAVSLVTDISSEMVTAVLPLYLVSTLGFSPLGFGTLDGVYNGVGALVQLAGGHLADRARNHKLLAGLGYGLSALCKPLLLLASGLGALGTVLALDRTGKGLRTAPRDAMISLSTPPETQGRAFGVHRAMDTTGAMLGPLAAFLILRAAADGYDAVFGVSTCVAALGVLVLVLFVPGRKERARGGAGGAIWATREAGPAGAALAPTAAAVTDATGATRVTSGAHTAGGAGRARAAGTVAETGAAQVADTARAVDTAGSAGPPGATGSADAAGVADPAHAANAGGANGPDGVADTASAADPDGQAGTADVPGEARTVRTAGVSGAAHAAGPANSRRPVRPGEALALLRLPRLRALAGCAALLGLTTVSDAFVYLLLQRRAGIGEEWFPLLPLGTAAVFLLLALPLGALADRIGRRTVFLAGHVALLTGYALLLWAPDTPVLPPVVLALHGAFYAATDGVLPAALADVVPEHLRASGLAVVGTSQALARFCCSLAFGAAWTAWGDGPALAGAAAGLLCCAAVAGAVLRPAGRTR